MDDSNECKVSYIAKDSPVNGKINLGDTILAINDENLNGDTEKLNTLVQDSESEINVKIKNGNEEKVVSIMPKEYSNYYIGVVFKQADKDIGTRLYYSWFETGDFILSLADNVKNLFTTKVSVNDMMGPILSLGITNLLPIPALDGGKIFILLIEAIRRKPLKENTEIFIQMIGFSLLILLSIYISYIDIIRFF